MMWKVYVGNLDARIKERELADEFRAYGSVRSVWVARNPPGYAFIEFDSRRDADDAVAGLDGKHGWRVEMSRKSVGGSVGGRNRGSRDSESRCYDCGAPGHFARECRSRSSRHSYRRTPSPHRSGSHRHSLTRNGHDGSRSPRRERTNSHKDRLSPRRKRERSRSRESDRSESRGPRRKIREQSRSPQHEKSDIISPQRKEDEVSRSPPNENTEFVSPERGHELSSSPQNDRSGTTRASPQTKGNESSRSPLSERSGERGPQSEECEPNRSPQGEGSNIEGYKSTRAQEHSVSPQPDRVSLDGDGYSPERNGSAGSRSPHEEKNGSYTDRDPGEEMVGKQQESD